MLLYPPRVPVPPVGYSWLSRGFYTKHFTQNLDACLNNCSCYHYESNPVGISAIHAETNAPRFSVCRALIKPSVFPRLAITTLFIVTHLYSLDLKKWPRDSITTPRSFDHSGLLRVKSQTDFIPSWMKQQAGPTMTRISLFSIVYGLALLVSLMVPVVHCQTFCPRQASLQWQTPPRVVSLNLTLMENICMDRGQCWDTPGASPALTAARPLAYPQICPLQLQHGDTLLVSADQTLRSYGVRLASVSEDGFESCSTEGRGGRRGRSSAALRSGAHRRTPAGAWSRDFTTSSRRTRARCASASWASDSTCPWGDNFVRVPPLFAFVRGTVFVKPAPGTGRTAVSATSTTLGSCARSLTRVWTTRVETKAFVWAMDPAMQTTERINACVLHILQVRTQHFFWGGVAEYQRFSCHKLFILNVLSTAELLVLLSISINTWIVLNTTLYWFWTFCGKQAFLINSFLSS